MNGSGLFGSSTPSHYKLLTSRARASFARKSSSVLSKKKAQLTNRLPIGDGGAGSLVADSPSPNFSPSLRSTSPPHDNTPSSTADHRPKPVRVTSLEKDRRSGLSQRYHRARSSSPAASRSDNEDRNPSRSPSRRGTRGAFGRRSSRDKAGGRGRSSANVNKHQAPSEEPNATVLTGTKIGDTIERLIRFQENSQFQMWLERSYERPAEDSDEDVVGLGAEGNVNRTLSPAPLANNKNDNDNDNDNNSQDRQSDASGTVSIGSVGRGRNVPISDPHLNFFKDALGLSASPVEETSPTGSLRSTPPPGTSSQQPNGTPTKDSQSHGHTESVSAVLMEELKDVDDSEKVAFVLHFADSIWKLLPQDQRPPLEETSKLLHQLLHEQEQQQQTALPPPHPPHPSEVLSCEVFAEDLSSVTHSRQHNVDLSQEIEGRVLGGQSSQSIPDSNHMSFTEATPGAVLAFAKHAVAELERSRSTTTTALQHSFQRGAVDKHTALSDAYRAVGSRADKDRTKRIDSFAARMKSRHSLPASFHTLSPSKRDSTVYIRKKSPSPTPHSTTRPSTATTTPAKSSPRSNSSGRGSVITSRPSTTSPAGSTPLHQQRSRVPSTSPSNGQSGDGTIVQPKVFVRASPSRLSTLPITRSASHMSHITSEVPPSRDLTGAKGEEQRPATETSANNVSIKSLMVNGASPTGPAGASSITPDNRQPQHSTGGVDSTTTPVVTTGAAGDAVGANDSSVDDHQRAPLAAAQESVDDPDEDKVEAARRRIHERMKRRAKQ